MNILPRQSILGQTVVATTLVLAMSLSNVAAAEDTALFQRGDYLASIMLCKGCHTPMTSRYEWQFENDNIRLTGGMKIVFPPYGAFYTKNLTPDVETGLGAWSKQDIVNAVKHGVSKDGRPLKVMPFPAFRHLSDADTDALVHYLQKIPPVRHWIPPNERMGWFDKLKAGLRLITPGLDNPSQDWYYGDSGSFEPPATPNRTTFFPEPRDSQLELPAIRGANALVEHGRYLATISLCVGCHTPVNTSGLDTRYMLAGGFRILDPACGVVYSANLTPDPETGLGRWSDEEIALAIRHGTGRDHRALCQTIMPSTLYRNMTDEDVAAIIAYLRALSPIRHAIPRSKASADIAISAQRFILGDAGK